MTSSGLALINSYTDDEDELDVTTNSLDNDSTICTPKKLIKLSTQETSVTKNRLPLPSTIVQLFKNIETIESPQDDPNLHEGRVRSFAHKRGNWSTYVYIPYTQEEGFDELRERLGGIAAEAGLQMKNITEPHISLTKTVVLLHHWIDSFVSSVKSRLSKISRISVHLGAPEIYCNEERTRTFLGLKVVSGSTELISAATALDECLAEFRLPPFYQDPSFHMSILWIVGDFKTQLGALLPKLYQEFHAYVSEYNIDLVLNVSECLCKTGNKLFSFPLAS